MSSNNSPYLPERSCIYMIPYYQLSLVDIFSDFQEIYESNKSQFLSLLQQNINLDEIVPASLKAFLCINGQNPKIPIIQRIFLSSPIPFFLSFSAIHDIIVNSAALTRFRILLKSLGLSRTSLKISRLFLSDWLTLLNQSAMPLIPARQI